MATAPPTRAISSTLPTAAGPRGADSVWRAPLVPVALAATAGIVLDRYVGVPLMLSLPAVVAGVVAWLCASLWSRSAALPLVCLGLAVGSAGAARHHLYRDVYPADDIGNYAPAEPRLAHLRGVLDEEPLRLRSATPKEFLSIAHPDPTVTVLAVTQLEEDDAWHPVSGRAELRVAGPLEGLHAGDEVDVLGLLSAPDGPANPGGFDEASHLRDRGIRATVLVHKVPDGVVRLTEGWPRSLRGRLAQVKAWGQTALDRYLPGQSGLAQALLLGRGSPLTEADWEKYKRAGVVHVLVVSGLHVAVLGWFLWRLLWLVGVRGRPAAVAVALLVFGYALLTGPGMPILRGAVAVGVLCGGILLRRPVLFANALALAWLVIALLNPADLFTLGCRLSFLAVAVLHWGPGGWFRPGADPLARLIEESRPAWQRALLGLGRLVWQSYLATLAVWLAEAPLVAADVHVVSPVALLIGPPLMLLSVVALASGFLLLLTAAVAWPLAPLFALPAGWSLTGCDWLVSKSLEVPGSSWYVSDTPAWWLWVLYLGLLAVLLLGPVRRRWGWALLAGAVWLCVGLLAVLPQRPADELRCTFLAVGHGGCTVLEAPDGRVLLYDAGALGGPDVTRRHIAPYLWSRGVRRVDEVFLSHADLDHFNGLVELMDRFAVGQVTLTPTFADKATGGVRLTLEEIDRRGIPRRVVRAGDWLTAGDVQLEVLHPPPEGPEGNENARSLVLLVRHAGHALLLTGDLEGPGLARVLGLPEAHVDVLQAPHHGSRASNTPELAAWARPRVVVSCEGPPLGGVRAREPYSEDGARFLGTWPHGAVTVRSHRTGLVVETFRTGQRFAVRSERAP
jgi:competence protein ComEC